MIVVEGLRKSYVRQSGSSLSVVHAIDGVDLTIRDGEFIALIGPSGCGKTTLLKIVAGLVGFQGGSVAIDGSPVTGPGPDRAMVFQNFALLPWRNVLGNVELGLEALGVPREKRRETSGALIELVGLAGFEHHYPHELSGGMQQRAGLARALAVRPKSLLMDEPFGALDEQTRRVIHEDLLRIWEEQRQTVIFVTHSMDEAVYLADRVVVMSSRPGRIREVLDIPLPRPRQGDEVRRTPEYAELTEYIWSLLKDESRVMDRGD